MSKKAVLNYLHNLFSYNVIGDKQYSSRYNGFNGELHFSQWFSQNKPNLTCNGGLFIPLTNTDDSLRDSIYIVTSPYPAADFCKSQLQSVANNLKTTRGQFLVQYNPNEKLESWKTLNIPYHDSHISVPFPSSLTIHQYNKSSNNIRLISMDVFFKETKLKPAFKKQAAIPDKLKNEFISKLSKYNFNIILDLYVGRFVLDGLCSRLGIDGKTQRGAPLDIDLFALDNHQKWSIFEIKEKTLSRNECFGMDTRRINSLMRVSDLFNSPAYYVVRHVDNQTDRNFIDWKVIAMKSFNHYAPDTTVLGGFGMRSENTKNPTRLCNVDRFQLFK